MLMMAWHVVLRYMIANNLYAYELNNIKCLLEMEWNMEQK
jgi:hypothetical protein